MRTRRCVHFSIAGISLWAAVAGGIAWRLGDDAGRPFAAELYLVKLQSGGDAATTRPAVIPR